MPNEHTIAGLTRTELDEARRRLIEQAERGNLGALHIRPRPPQPRNISRIPTQDYVSWKMNNGSLRDNGIARDTNVQVLLSSGAMLSPRRAGSYRWTTSSPRIEDDIIAFKVV